ILTGASPRPEHARRHVRPRAAGCEDLGHAADQPPPPTNTSGRGRSERLTPPARPPDPASADKARTVCDLYLHSPAGSVLFCLDENAAMQPKSRKSRTRPRRPEQREFEYVRHGTVSLMAAMNVTDAPPRS